MKSNTFTILFILIGYLVNAQCNVKTNSRSDGVVVRYLNPELVGKGSNCELGLSVQTNGVEYFLSTTVRYFQNAKKLSGNLKVQLSNTQSLDLKIFTSELAAMRNENVGIGIFYLSEADISKLKNSTIKTVIFKDTDGVNNIVTLNQNFDVAIRQINCLNY